MIEQAIEPSWCMPKEWNGLLEEDIDSSHDHKWLCNVLFIGGGRHVRRHEDGITPPFP